MRISLDHLCKSFDGVEVLRDITFDEEVSALAIIGPSGGGKSTLLRIIGGLETPTSGAMAVDGSPVYLRRDVSARLPRHLGVRLPRWRPVPPHDRFGERGASLADGSWRELRRG